MIWQTPQLIALGLLALALILFVWGRIRYDVAAMAVLLLGVICQVVAPVDAFSGFSHPAVITVALVLVLSKAIQLSGFVDLIAKPLESLTDRPLLFTACLCLVAAVLSGFMNNVGALALLMPLAISLTDKPARLLMPLSFATILGGMTTLIGTPPNIIVASYREELTGTGFSLFDFSAVGIILMLMGLLFIVTIGWRLIPKNRTGPTDGDSYSQHAFLAELIVEPDSDWVGKRIADLEGLFEGELVFLGVRRGGTRLFSSVRTIQLQAEDILILRSSPEDLEACLKQTDLILAGSDTFEDEHLVDEDVGLMECVVARGSVLEGRTPKAMRLRRRHNVNLLGISRQGAGIMPRLAYVRFQVGDVLLMQGSQDSLRDTMTGLGCLPIASKAISLGRPALNLWPVGLFAGAIGLTAFGLLPIYLAFALALGCILIFGHLSNDKLYSSIDWPIIVLLAAMIPLGDALTQTGATTQISQLLVSQTGAWPVWLVLIVILLVTMTLSDLMNNAATAVVMAPLAAQVAQQFGHSADPYLMTVALGASCAFLTPIGHQNNLLVMGPGGYRFGDYWRMGLPLQLIIMAVGIPLILLVWPL